MQSELSRSLSEVTHYRPHLQAVTKHTPTPKHIQTLKKQQQNRQEARRKEWERKKETLDRLLMQCVCLWSYQHRQCYSGEKLEAAPAAAKARLYIHSYTRVSIIGILDLYPYTSIGLSTYSYISSYLSRCIYLQRVQLFLCGMYLWMYRLVCRWKRCRFLCRDFLHMQAWSLWAPPASRTSLASHIKRQRASS